MDWKGRLRTLFGLPPRWPTTPTSEYYFLAAIRDLIAESSMPVPGRPIVRRGPNTWVCGRRLVIIRYATSSELLWIEGRAWQSVHYVIDDLLPAAATSTELPADYRERLSRFASTILPRILALKPIVVAPSRAILSQFPELVGRHLHPTFLSIIGGEHPATPPPPGPTLDVAFLGTRSHTGTLPFLEAIAAGLKRCCPEARL